MGWLSGVCVVALGDEMTAGLSSPTPSGTTAPPLGLSQSLRRP